MSKAKAEKLAEHPWIRNVSKQEGQPMIDLQGYATLSPPTWKFEVYIPQDDFDGLCRLSGVTNTPIWEGDQWSLKGFSSRHLSNFFID